MMGFAHPTHIKPHVGWVEQRATHHVASQTKFHRQDLSLTNLFYFGVKYAE